MSEHTVKDFLANHPRMMGVLFAATFLLWESGAVMAVGPSSTTKGP